jgi:hypothetical protein
MTATTGVDTVWVGDHQDDAQAMGLPLPPVAEAIPTLREVAA